MSEDSNQNNPSNIISRIKSNKMLLGGIIGAFLVLSIISFILLGIFIGTGNKTGVDQEAEATLIAIAAFQTMQADENKIQNEDDSSSAVDSNKSTKVPKDTSETPTPERLMATTTMNLNCRFGPNQVFSVIATLLKDDTIPIIGRNENSSWYYVEIPNSSYKCWVWIDGIIILGDQSKVTIVDSPPMPNTNTPPTTSIPSPSPTATHAYLSPCDVYTSEPDCNDDIINFGNCYWDWNLSVCTSP